MVPSEVANGPPASETTTVASSVVENGCDTEVGWMVSRVYEDVYAISCVKLIGMVVNGKILFGTDWVVNCGIELKGFVLELEFQFPNAVGPLVLNPCLCRQYLNNHVPLSMISLFYVRYNYISNERMEISKSLPHKYRPRHK